MNIGFIGIGAMGEGMAPNLLAAGHRVSVYNRMRGRAAALVGAGAAAVPMPIATLREANCLTALAHGWGDLDWAGLALISAEAAGLSRRDGSGDA